MIEAQIFLSYRRDLNNLSVQEARLRRQYEKDEAELKRQIAEREKAAQDCRMAENRRWQNAIDHYRTAQKYGVPFDPAEIGFEFSTEEIAARERQIEAKAAIDSGRYYEYKKKGYLNLPGKAA
jgi:hypothetical protein